MRREPSRPLRLRLLLAGLSLLLLGCGRAAPSPKLPGPPPAAPAEARPAAPEPVQPRTGQAPRVMVFAGPPPGMTVTQAPPEPEREPEPTAAFASLQLACDSVEALAKRQRLPVSRKDGVPVDFGFGGSPRSGCELKATGKLAPAGPPDSTGLAKDEPSTLADEFKQAGWAYMAQYQADGPDGEAEGWRSKETTCVVRWSWDGGDDSDSTYVPSDDFDLVIGCAPWNTEDLRRD